MLTNGGDSYPTGVVMCHSSSPICGRIPPVLSVLCSCMHTMCGISAVCHSNWSHNDLSIIMYSVIIVRLTHTNVWESMGKPCSCTQFLKSHIFYCKYHHSTRLYHTSNSRECMGVNGEALQLHAVYKKLYFLLQVTQEFVSVLQVA